MAIGGGGEKKVAGGEKREEELGSRERKRRRSQGVSRRGTTKAAPAPTHPALPVPHHATAGRARCPRHREKCRGGGKGWGRRKRVWPEHRNGEYGRAGLGGETAPGLSDALGAEGAGRGRGGGRAPLPPAPQPPASRASAPPRSYLLLTGIFSLRSVEWWNVFTLSFLELGLRPTVSARMKCYCSLASAWVWDLRMEKMHSLIIN